MAVARHITRWDLDKTYLRTEFDSIRDLLKTAFERPDQKLTNPGAGTLLREFSRSGASVHILSGSPQQMRGRLEEKLRLDGITWDTFTLKPNLQNVLRLRFRALRDQLGYKLPALLSMRAQVGSEDGLRCETLFGDDAEADAFVYSVYADVIEGRLSEEQLIAVCEKGNVYPDVLANILRYARIVERARAVEHIFIHLERQTSPDDFATYGRRVVPFYNYLQPAFVLQEDGRLSADGVLRVAVELVVQHRFDADALARSYLEMARRGHLAGTGIPALRAAFAALSSTGGSLPARAELETLMGRLDECARVAKASVRPRGSDPLPDYVSLVRVHNPRRR